MFDLSASAAGYDISQIDLYTNWGALGGRDEIKVSISYSLVENPTLFNQNIVTEVVYDPPAGSTQALTSISGINASGVAAIRFEWPYKQENGGVGYAEIDVKGKKTDIPEPASFALLLSCAVMLSMAQRKR